MKKQQLCACFTIFVKSQVHLNNQILSLLENGSGKMINSMTSVGSGPLSYFPFPLSNWVTWDNGKTFKGMQSQSFFQRGFYGRRRSRSS